MVSQEYEVLKENIRAKILEVLPINFFEVNDDATISRRISELTWKFLPRHLREQGDKLVKELLQEFLGFGPLEPLIADPLITEIMINGPEKIFIEKDGKLERADIRFKNKEQLMYYIERILTPLGKRITELEPYVDAQLPDGSRVNIVIPPMTRDVPVMTIRKFWAKVWNLQDLVKLETLDNMSAGFLSMVVRKRKNIFVCGGAGVGKTTMVNALAREIPNEERTIVIEDVPEIRMYQDNVVYLQTRMANIEGKGEITLRDLVKNSLHMRPDRIIIGEIRGEEVLDILQAMNTGHEGSMCTIHANSTQDALYRIETLMFLSGVTNISSSAIRRIIGAAVDILIFMRRTKEGKRKIYQISEVILEADTLKVCDIFKRNQEGILVRTGYVPTFGME